MKFAKLSLQHEKNKSFIVHDEVYPFAPFHHHPEYELVLIRKGKGRRMIGDNIDRFDENDLIFMGPYLPHQWICDMTPDIEQSRAFVIQFDFDFLGNKFFDLPENVALKKFLGESVRGYRFFGETRDQIISILVQMMNRSDTERLYDLFSIFKIFSSCHDFLLLSSPDSIDSFSFKENEKMHKALQYILQHFHNKIHVDELLAITNMSYPTFYSHFNRNYKMSYKQYLLDLRIEYACKLLKDDSMSVSEIAFNCGFGNLSNFNRQFRKIKKTTPSNYQKNITGQPEEVFMI